MKAKGTICAAAVVVSLAGCGTGATTTPTPSTMVVATSIARTAENGAAMVGPSRSGASTMRPDAAKRNKLLYISDSEANDVTVYAWPGYTLEGTLHGFNQPQGLCGDSKGDVWVVSTGSAQIVEYAHGGPAPIAILSETGYFPAGCSVDPTTGNLAVTNITAASGNPGNVAVFAHGQGSPKYYMMTSNISRPIFCGYDRDGNLFVDGNTVGVTGFGFTELAKHARKFKVVWLTQTLGYPGGILWDGKHLAVGDQDTNTVYQVDVAGQSGKIVGSTVLSGARDVAQFGKHGGFIIGPDLAASTAPIWKYPAGGNPTRTITDGIYQPVAAVVSESPMSP
jgi:hypothetical protein